jgi:hypothetical protein
MKKTLCILAALLRRRFGSCGNAFALGIAAGALRRLTSFGGPTSGRYTLCCGSGHRFGLRIGCQSCYSICRGDMIVKAAVQAVWMV